MIDSLAPRPQSWLGARARRIEDPRLLTGNGTYVDDIELPGMLYAAFLRSNYAHARINSIDTSAAMAMTGVHKVCTQQDLTAMGVGDLPCIWLRPGQKNTSNPLLARGKVLYVGQPIAVVVADSRELAEDAVDAIGVEYEELPPVVDAFIAMQPDTQLLYEDWGTNVVWSTVVEGGNPEQALAEADLVLQERFQVQRYTGVPLETRGVVVNFDPAGRDSQSVTVWLSTQVVHHARDVIASVLNWPQNRLRVVALDVGGGFGPKDHVYEDEIAVVALGLALKHPIKWIEDRREHLVGTVHAREQVHDVQLAVRRDGVILGVRDRMVANIGAYCSNVGPGPVQLTKDMVPGPYRIANYRAEVVAVVTNKVPAGAYRGFGMTQATFVMERLVDLVAAKLSLDPAEVRRRNFVPPDEFPYRSVTGVVYDSGDYGAAMERALTLADYSGWRAKQADLRTRGRYIGIGIGCYVEAAGFGPSRALGQIGFRIPGYDVASVRMDPQGRVTLATGISSQGQSHETTFAQVCASVLGVDLDTITVVQGDTAMTPYASAGAIASRGAAVAGGATVLASRLLRTKLERIAAHLLEASPDDIKIEQSRAFVQGSPARSVSISTVATAALLGHDLPDGVTPGLDEQVLYDPPALTYPYATHVAIVEIDPQTGQIRFLKYVVVHDCGTMINPTVVEGQVHGGVVQGIGGALLEDLAYSSDGMPLSTSFMDYLLPTATDAPDIVVDHLETPSPHTPGGMKGMGEGGAIASPAAIANAVEDALQPFGIEVRSTPLSPSVIWHLLAEARSRKEANE